MKFSQNTQSLINYENFKSINKVSSASENQKY